MLKRTIGLSMLALGLGACTTVPLGPNEVEVCQPGSALPHRINVPPGVDHSSIPRRAPTHGLCLYQARRG